MELYRRSKSQDIVLEMKRRRLRWLGHTLRMNANRTPKIALRWTPLGKIKQGRPKKTWRRTITSELKEMGLPWVKHRGLQVTECNGGRRLMPYVPLGMSDKSAMEVDALCPSKDGK